MNFNLFKRHAVPAASSVTVGGDASQLEKELGEIDRQVTRISRAMGTLPDHAPGRQERSRYYAPALQRLTRLHAMQCIASVGSAIEQGRAQGKTDLAAARNRLEDLKRVCSDVEAKLQTRRAAHKTLSDQIQAVHSGAKAALEIAEQALIAAVQLEDAAATAAATKQLQQAQRAFSKAEEDGRASDVQLSALLGIIQQLESEHANAQETAVRVGKDIESAVREALALDLDGATFSTMEAALKLLEGGGGLPHHVRVMPFCSAALLLLLRDPAMQRMQACDASQLKILLSSLAVHPDEHLVEAYPFAAEDEQILKRVALGEAEAEKAHQRRVQAAVEAASADGLRIAASDHLRLHGHAA